MPIVIALPDEKLAGFAESYGFFAIALDGLRTSTVDIVVFNLSNAPIVVDGKRRDEPCLLGLATDPVFADYSIGSGPLLTLRLFPGAFARLLGIDLSRERGIVGLDPRRHFKVAAIDARLRSVAAEPKALFAALDAALLDLLPEAAPTGLAERFTALCLTHAGDLTVAEALDTLGCTARTLERATAARFGRTPKRLLRGYRVWHTRERERSSGERAELLAEFPFADLPHYLNETRRITGLNRKQLTENFAAEDALPYRYFWSDGSEAAEADWYEERVRRWER